MEPARHPVIVAIGHPKRWSPRTRRVVHYAIAATLYLVLAALFIHDWDGFVFETSVRDFWHGHSPYEVAENAPFYTFLNIQDAHPQWYAYPPLPLLAMSVTYAPEMLWNVAPPLERILLKLPMVIGTLALAFVGEAWARHLGKDEATVRRVRKLLLFNPFIIIIGPVWGMTDPALVALFLAGALQMERGRAGLGGLLLGLSALVKPFPILLALPLAALSLYEHGWKQLWKMVGAAALTCAIVCLPFILTTPRGFLQQTALFHLTRAPQGWSVWRLLPEGALSLQAIQVLSFSLMAFSLLLLALVSPHVRVRSAAIFVTLAASVQVLFWNRVVNDQYLVLIVAPLLLLKGLGELRSVATQRLARLFPAFMAGLTSIMGYHFLTFIPPDIALHAFGSPVDVVAEHVRRWLHPVWPILQHARGSESFDVTVFLLAVGVYLFAAYRFLARWVPSISAGHTMRSRGVLHSRAYACGATALLVMVALFPGAAPEGSHPSPAANQADDHRALVGAFYYLWWNNPSHDPTIRYGNWIKVSQSPEMGYYTNTRAVARDHVRMMLENGIDVAVVSYHTGEFERFKVFLEEATQQGLLVAPLIELNQIYDQPAHHALSPNGTLVPYAGYRLDDGTREAIESFVLELKPLLTGPYSLYRQHGAPVVFFYDSYVSAVSYDDSSQRALAQTLLDLYPIGLLRQVFADPQLRPNPASMLAHFPRPDGPLEKEDSPAKAFYQGARTPINNVPGYTFINQSAYWRNAFLELHRQFWQQIRADVERETGPLFLVSGEAFNEHAGFEAGTIKGLVGHDVFDGSFIYSPSFVWGDFLRDPKVALRTYSEVFRAWEDRNIWLTTTALGSGRYSAYGVAPAYDDTVNRPVQGFRIPAFPGGDTTYDRMWNSALAHTPDLVLVATFNEFFEGSSIESSREYKSLFLNRTAYFHERLANQPQPTADIVVLLHERSSRTNPLFSEQDKPHEWGLRLVSATARAFPGSRITTLDGLDDKPVVPGPPSLLLIDGGRDAYGADSLSPPVRQLVQHWVGNGVPTLILGREVAAPLRDLALPSCRENGVLPLGRSIDPSGKDDPELANGDTLIVDPRDAGYVLLQRGPSVSTIGYRCPEQPNIAFLNAKPWAADHSWTYTQPSDAACMLAVAAPLDPSLVDVPAPRSCQAVVNGVLPSSALH